MGVIYYRQKDIDKSIQFHLKNLEQSNVDGVFVSSYNLGVCYKAKADSENALLFFEKSLDCAKLLDDKHAQCISFGQLGLIYAKQNESTKAYDYLNVKIT